MTRKEFIAAFYDEELSDALRAHAAAENLCGPRLSDDHHKELGRYTAATMRKVTDKLGRMYDAMHPAAARESNPAVKLANGTAARAV